jgi:hypothetical protein
VSVIFCSLLSFSSIVVSPSSSRLAIFRNHCVAFDFFQILCLRAIVTPRNDDEKEVNVTVTGKGSSWLLSYVSCRTLHRRLFVFAVRSRPDGATVFRASQLSPVMSKPCRGIPSLKPASTSIQVFKQGYPEFFKLPDNAVYKVAIFTSALTWGASMAQFPLRVPLQRWPERGPFQAPASTSR